MLPKITFRVGVNMAVAIQLEFFEKTDEMTLIQKELAAMQESNANVRRGLFARLDAMGKLVMDQQKEIEELKKNFTGV